MKKCEFYSVHIEKGKKFVKLLKWVRGRYNGDIWRCLIRWEWLPGVCVPYNTNGKIRCERVELLEVVK